VTAMNKKSNFFSLKYAAAAVSATAVIVLSILMPAKVSQIYDNAKLDTIQKEDASDSPESFRYSLTAPERLYIISMALNNRKDRKKWMKKSRYCPPIISIRKAAG